jgi:putative transposase
LTHGEIPAHLRAVYGAEVSKQTISTITDKVIEGMSEWQNRPFDPIYPVVFIDRVHVHVKIRDGQVANRPVSMEPAVTCDGMREILGLWAGEGGEGAKYRGTCSPRSRTAASRTCAWWCAAGSRAFPRRSLRSGRRR